MTPFQKCIQTFDKIDEQIHEMNCKLYKAKLLQMDEEQLHQEFNDRIGGELREYEFLMAHDGRNRVINYLQDCYEVGT